MTARAILIALPLLLLMLHGAASVAQEKPFASVGIVEGRVTRPGATDGVPDAEIVLQGPAFTFDSSALSGLYKPKPELTPAMRGEIARAIDEAPFGVAIDYVANLASRVEARLLGLPDPAGITPTPEREPREITTVSDADGRFRFDNVAPGRYRIRAQREGYFGVSRTGSVERGLLRQDSETITVAEGKPAVDVAFHLTAGGVIAGRVRDPKGRALVNFPVAVYQVVYREGRAEIGQVKSTQTDDRGDYRLVWLAPGSYFVAANPPRPSTVRSRDGWVRTFQSGALDPRDVPPIIVAEAGIVNTVDIQVRAEAVWKISGRIVNPLVDSKGQPIAPSGGARGAEPSGGGGMGVGPPGPGTLYLSTRDTKTLDSERVVVEFQNMAPKVAPGVFEIRNVATGAYDLWISAPVGGGRMAWGHTAVDVVDRDLDDVAIAIKPGIEVTVRFTGDGAPPVTPAPAQPAAAEPAAARAGQTPFQVRLTARNAPEGALRFAFLARAATTAGVFTFPPAPEGRYNLSVQSLPVNAYVEDIRQGGVSVYDEGLEVSVAAADVEVIVRTNGATVEGTIADREGHPFASALVTLIPQQSRRGNLALYKTTTSTRSGSYVFKGVPPGEYKLFAWETVPANAWTNPGFMTQFEPQGKAVSVSSGAPTAADLTVIPKPRVN